MRHVMYEYAVDEEQKHWLRVIERYERGLADFMVAYYVVEEGGNAVIVTWDCTHGFAHRDLRYLEEGDKRRKTALPRKPLPVLLDESLADAWRNWPRYYAEYLEKKVNT